MPKTDIYLPAESGQVDPRLPASAKKRAFDDAQKAALLPPPLAGLRDAAPTTADAPVAMTDADRWLADFASRNAGIRSK